MPQPDFLHVDADHEIRFKGHRLRLIDIAARFVEGHSAEGIAFEIYPTLDLPLVYKAIEIYLERQTEFGETMDRNSAEIARQAAKLQRSPGAAELRRRISRNRPATAS